MMVGRAWVSCRFGVVVRAGWKGLAMVEQVLNGGETRLGDYWGEKGNRMTALNFLDVNGKKVPCHSRYFLSRTSETIFRQPICGVCILLSSVISPIQTNSTVFFFFFFFFRNFVDGGTANERFRAGSE